MYLNGDRKKQALVQQMAATRKAQYALKLLQEAEMELAGAKLLLEQIEQEERQEVAE